MSIIIVIIHSFTPL